MARPLEAVDVDSKFDHVVALWSPRILARFNGLRVKLARGRGEFVWHRHEDTDELFWIHPASAEIQMRDRRAVRPVAGDLFAVPARVEHRPVVEDECELLLIEPANTPNTGDVATATEEEWI